MTSPTNVIGMAAARDLNVGGLDGLMTQAQQEELRKKKMTAQQQANGTSVAPFTGAFMSLSGNQF